MAPSAPLPAPPTSSRKCSTQPNRHPPRPALFKLSLRGRGRGRAEAAAPRYSRGIWRRIHTAGAALVKRRIKTGPLPPPELVDFDVEARAPAKRRADDPWRPTWAHERWRAARAAWVAAGGIGLATRISANLRRRSRRPTSRSAATLMSIIVSAPTASTTGPRDATKGMAGRYDNERRAASAFVPGAYSRHRPRTQ